MDWFLYDRDLRHKRLKMKSRNYENAIEEKMHKQTKMSFNLIHQRKKKIENKHIKTESIFIFFIMDISFFKKSLNSAVNFGRCILNFLL